MSSLALYRKYRSKSLDEIIGQAHITDILKTAISTKRFAHAYLLTGPRGTGKTSIARILAHEINNLPYTDDSSSLDIIEIDAASNRRIDDIRELREKVHIAPVSNPYKIYIIDEVHMLTSESFNALLKTLEEPPAHVIFILATTELHKLPATIISRTQRYNFRLIEQGDMIAHLRHIANEESIKINDEALALIAEHGEGAFRDSINLLDQLASTTNDELTGEVVESTLGLAPHDQIAALAQACLKQQADPAYAQLTQFQRDGIAVASITRQLITLLQSSAAEQPSLYQLIDKLIDVPRSDNARLKLLTTILLYINQPQSPIKPSQSQATTTQKEPALTISAVVAKPKKRSPPQTTPDLQPASEPQETMSEDKWPAVLDHIKSTNPPLFAVIKHAAAAVEQEGRVLALTFGYKLHAKKIDDPKYRAQLAKSLVKIANAHPEVIIKIEPSSQPVATPTKPATPGNSQTSSVIAMMGGGELIDAGQI